MALVDLFLVSLQACFALKKGFSLGRAHVTNKVNGAVLPRIVTGILVVALCTSLPKVSQTGPGSMHAPVIASLLGGLVFAPCSEIKNVFCRKYA